MKTDIQITPENKDEAELVERMIKLRNYAQDETDVDADEISSLFAYVSASVETDTPINHGQSKFECPECGLPAEDVSAQNIGEKPIVTPCECKTNWTSIPPSVVFDFQN